MHKRGQPGQGNSSRRSGTRGLLIMVSRVGPEGRDVKRPTARRRRGTVILMAGTLAGGLVISMVSAAPSAQSATAGQAGTATIAHGPGAGRGWGTGTLTDADLRALVSQMTLSEEVGM